MNTDKAFAEKLTAEYAPKKTSRVVSLRKLDQKAKLGPTAFAYTLGVVSALLLGVGMCLSLKVIGDGSPWQNIVGYVVGSLGILGVAINYPIFKRFLARQKQKYASDIIALANEVAKE